MSTFDLAWWRTQRRVSVLAVWLWHAADQLVMWHERARQRRQLRSLSERMLRDIGLTRGDVMAESSKPFWRL
jgi:uncharacterized protein YjiS (DUF1127 family)